LGGQLGVDEPTDTIINANLHHTRRQKLQSLNYTEHNWKIYVTDIFEAGKGQYPYAYNFKILY